MSTILILFDLTELRASNIDLLAFCIASMCRWKLQNKRNHDARDKMRPAAFYALLSWERNNFFVRTRKCASTLFTQRKKEEAWLHTREFNLRVCVLSPNVQDFWQLIGRENRVKRPLGCQTEWGNTASCIAHPALPCLHTLSCFHCPFAKKSALIVWASMLTRMQRA